MRTNDLYWAGWEYGKKRLSVFGNQHLTAMLAAQRGEDFLSGAARWLTIDVDRYFFLLYNR